MADGELIAVAYEDEIKGMFSILLANIAGSGEDATPEQIEDCYARFRRGLKLARAVRDKAISIVEESSS